MANNVVDSYYKLSYVEEWDVLQVNTPENSSGDALVSGKQLLPGTYKSEYTVKHVADISRFDLVPCLTKELVLSPRAMDVIKIMSLPPCASIVPVKVGDCLLYSLHFSSHTEALDESTEYKYGRTGNFKLAAKLPVIKKRLISKLDIFNVFYVGIVCSGSFKETILSEGLKNFRFNEIPHV